MNPYLKHLQKIEFVLTWSCTGACKHCSQGDHPSGAGCLDPALGAKALRELAAKYKPETVMVFGGEPLLFPEAVTEIMTAAQAVGIPRRQVITNGFFTKSPEKIRKVATALAESGVNDLLLSVDAFHQETIPPETVRAFALAAQKAAVPLRLQPAWLVSPDDDNPYNEKTRSILSTLQRDGFSVGKGNVIFPEGNAKKIPGGIFYRFRPTKPLRGGPQGRPHPFR